MKRWREIRNGGKRLRIRKAALLAATLLSVLSLFGAAAGVDASAAEGTSIPRVTFTNEPTNQPDLFITKTVTSVNGEYPAPEDTVFTFTLEWDLDRDGKETPAKNEKYYLYDEEGNLVTNTDAQGNTTDYFLTDGNGSFTLLAGQTAKFEYVGTNVPYTVTEEEPDVTGFYQTTNGGMPVTGVVDADGTIVKFENSYSYTPEPPDTPDDETTSLVVKKYISYPTGYETPDFEKKFTFQIKINNQLLADSAYVLYDASGNEISADDGGSFVTDANGRFTLKADQYAVFSGIAVGADYEVTELSENSEDAVVLAVNDSTTDGWTLVKTTGSEGLTTAAEATAYFTNSIASFVVKKDMDDDSASDQEFTFTVTDKNGTPVSNLTYYLYDKNGNLIEYDDGDGNPTSIRRTDEDGQFSLTARQRAVFTGLAPGTVYSVTENFTEGYSASPAAGYTDQTVSTAAQTLAFVNTKLLGGVQIIKEDEDGTVLSGVTFELAGVTDNTIQYTQTSNAKGVVQFSELEPGTYILTETAAKAGYTLLTESVEITIPLVLTKTDIEKMAEEGITVDTSAAYVDGNNYYFYNLTYHVTNGATLTLPTTGGDDGWIGWLTAGIAVVLAGLILLQWKRKTGVKGERS